MKNWTIGKRIILGFSATLVLVIALAITSFYLLEASAGSIESVKLASMIILGISGAIVVFGAIFAGAIVTSLNKDLAGIVGSLSEGVNQVAGAANQVSSASQSLADGASRQAASIEETSASLTEISSTTENNAQMAQTTKDFTMQTRTAAEKGAQSTQKMSKSIGGIKEASHKMGTAMDSIKSASADIADIIKTIDEIAFQTNLLALNAAVEAARAGEAGAGFAVVADEVRSLAQRSAKAAKETASMIETAIERSDAGVKANQEVMHAVEGVVAGSDEVMVSLEEIVIMIQQADDQVAQIASASKEQSLGVGQISTAVSEMEKVTQANASGAEESAAAAEELNSHAELLKGIVKELDALVVTRKFTTETADKKSRLANFSKSEFSSSQN
jgi:methyl-accepting chemotaxis protein